MKPALKPVEARLERLLKFPPVSPLQGLVQRKSVVMGTTWKVWFLKSVTEFLVSPKWIHRHMSTHSTFYVCGFPPIQLWFVRIVKKRHIRLSRKQQETMQKKMKVNVEYACVIGSLYCWIRIRVWIHFEKFIVFSQIYLTPLIQLLPFTCHHHNVPIIISYRALQIS